MKLNKFTVILAILLISIMAMGAVSAESVDDFGDVAAIDGDIQESVDVIDAADDLGTADTADETVGDEGGAVIGEGTNSYDLDDDNYADYFNEDGTAKEGLSANGDYSLNIGNLTNKDIIISSGSNINITAKEGAGFINNGTITISSPEGNAGSIIISGLTFTNVDKEGIVLDQYSNMITIDNNKFDLTFSEIRNGVAIISYGWVYGVTISNNVINIESAATNSYGIDIMLYLKGESEEDPWGPRGDSNPDQFSIISNTINLTCLPSSSVGEAIYLDTVTNSVVKDNNIYVKTVGTTVNYGLQLSDSYPWSDYTMDLLNSGHDVAITGNSFVLDSDDMVYGLTVISLSDMDMIEYEDLIRNFIISDNLLDIRSGTGAIGIGVKTSDVEVKDNKIFIAANPENPVHANVDNEFGDESVAIDVVNDAGMFGTYHNNTIIDNVICANVEAIKVLKEEAANQPLVVENNVIADFYINEDNYADYFNDDGTIKEGSGITDNSAICFDSLANKNIVIDIPLIIKGVGKLVDTTISLVAGADGTTISGLDMIYNDITGDTFAVIAINDGVSNVLIENNNITSISKEGADYWGYGPSNSAMAISVYGSQEGSKNITIVGNTITMTGEAPYTYGVDVQDYDAFWSSGKATTGLNVLNNKISLSGPGMMEPIYLAGCSDILVDGNTIEGISTGFKDAYGIGASGNNNFTATNNIITVSSQMMAFGISCAKSSDATMNNNVINAEGTGAIGIGFADTEDVNVDGNEVTITGGDFYSIYSADPLKTANAAIFDKSGNTNVNIGTNVVTENLPTTINDDNYADYFNEDGTIKEGAISDNDVIFLDKLTNKHIIIDIPLTVRGALGCELINTTIDIVTGADGTIVSNLNMNYEDSTGDTIGIIGVFDASDITVSSNTIVVKSIAGPDLYGYGPANSAMAIAVYAAPEVAASNIVIDGNTITMTGDAPYTYGIDVYNLYDGWTKGQAAKDVTITNNALTLSGSGVQEAIYLTFTENVLVDNNVANVVSGKEAYGIGSASVSDVTFTNNDLTVTAGTVAYGITSTTSKDLNIADNIITAEGTGAVGVGLVGNDNVNIESNEVSITGGDYTQATGSDYKIGAANAAILVGEGNTNVEVAGNDVTEVSAVRLDTVIEVSNLTVTAASSGNGSLKITLKTKSGMLLANQVVKVVFNNQMYELTTDANGVAVLSFPLNKGGTYNVEVFYLGDDDYRGSDASAKITIEKIATKTTASAKTYLATAKTKSFSATLKDANGNVLANKKVTFTVNGKTYTANTNAKGVATVKLALTAAKTYTVTIKFAGDGVYAASTVSAKVKLNKEKTKITAPKKTFKRTAKTKKVVITLKNSKGKAIAKKKITLIVNKKKYTVKTNKKGKATFKVKLTKKGTFKYTAKFAGDTQYKAVKKTGKIKIK